MADAHIPIDPRASDSSYCNRLLEVYLDLKSRNLLLAEPPLWAADYLVGLTADLLQQTPRLQAALASITSYTPSKWLLEQELSARIYQQRPSIRWDHEQEQKALLHACEQPPPPLSSCPATQATADSKSWSPGPVDVFDAAACQQLSGLCFSGGGIRSATFCLGILQALAASGNLRNFDYLSTVSGGGYIHQWFASWIRNEPGRFDAVQQHLKPLPAGSARAPEQINWLRRYSSYLTPRRGILSADTWTMFAIWFRNTFLNQIILFSFLILCLLAARSITYFFTFYRHGSYVLYHPWIRWAVLILLAISSLFCGFALASQSRDSRPGKLPAGALSNLGVVLLIVMPGFLISVAVALEAIGAVKLGEHSNFFFCYTLYFFEILLALTIGGQAYGSFKLLRSPSFWGKVKFMLGACASLGFSALLSLGIALYEYSAPVVEPYPSAASSTSTAAPEVVQTRAAAKLPVPAEPRAGTKSRTLGKPHPTARHLTLVTPQPAVKGPIPATPLPAAKKAAAPKPAPKKLGRESAKNVAQQTAKPVIAVIAAKPTITAFSPVHTFLYIRAFRIACFFNRHMGSATPQPCSLTDPQAPSGVEHPVTPQAVYAVFAPIVFFTLLFLAMRLQLGLLGRFYTEERREWLARLGGWSAIVSVLWMAFSGIGLFGPIVYYWLFDQSTTRRVSGILAALIIHAVTLFSGASGKSDGKPKPNKLFGYSAIDLLSMIGAPLCILCLLVIISGFMDIVINTSFAVAHWLPFVLASFVLLVFVIFGWRVDVNEFSLHGFYRNRLARCYLGATNPARSPDPFTGFDEHTEASTQSGMRLSELLPKRFGGQGFNEGTEAERQPYDGPFPIFCSTLNLTFGEDLAWQERKGASFAFTPLYSGYHVGWTGAQGKNKNTTFNGYIPTAEYAYPDQGIHLATVTAISGAALSPNMGFSSQPAVAFLMTLFNVRLGWWLANPRRPKVWPSDKMRPTPHFGIVSLLRELFGLSNDTSNYVCLCDGGRFENMGLYELVRRRCMLIVICDAEMDSMPVFEGIGLAISKCRTDFGAEITLDLNDLIPNLTDGLSQSHFQIGTIRYPKPPGSLLPDSAFLGKVIYLKTSITGMEPADILHYRRAFPNFPQDSTLNQWFTETQFESYRRLGQLTGEDVSPFL